MPIKNLNGGKTFPKRGRLGSGPYWPKGSPIAVNPFGPNSARPVTPPVPLPRMFGSPGNAGNNTQFGQNRVTSGAGLMHPNSGFHPNSQQNKTPALAIYQSNGTMKFETPYQPTPVIQPHERNRLLTRKAFGGPHKAASGVSTILPSDTPFHPHPPRLRAAQPTQAQSYTLATVRAGKAPGMTSHNNLWFDPNNSFLQGKKNINGDTGAPRWKTVKRGAAG